MKNRERQRTNRRSKHSEEIIVKCDLHHCVANKNGNCRILRSKDFGDRACPFFKTAEQNEQEKKAAIARLNTMSPQYVIDTYTNSKKGGADNGC